MEQDLTYQEKIELLEKEIDGLEMSIQQLKKENDVLVKTNRRLDEKVEEFIKLHMSIEEEHKRLVDRLFSQATTIDNLQKRYHKNVTTRKKTFTEWLFGKWQ